MITFWDLPQHVKRYPNPFLTLLKDADVTSYLGKKTKQTDRIQQALNLVNEAIRELKALRQTAIATATEGGALFLAQIELSLTLAK